LSAADPGYRADMTLFDAAQAPSTLDELRGAARRCQACPLYAHATQTVVGEGPAHAAVMLVGEQPGDQEDVQGHPFVGPAGKVLHQLLDEVGLPMEGCYVTNAVKHFKFEQRGKRRIHQRPNRAETTACHPWLAAELALVAPQVVVALGVVAASSLLQENVVLRNVRGRALEWAGPGRLVVTAHPSSLLRTDDPDERERARAAVLDDLRLAVTLASEV
jgi:uracil-DNA glycosylase family protein